MLMMARRRRGQRPAAAATASFEAQSAANKMESQAPDVEASTHAPGSTGLHLSACSNGIDSKQIRQGKGDKQR